MVLGLYQEDYLQLFLNVYSFDYTASAHEVSGEGWDPLTGFTTQIEWMLSVTSAIDCP